MAGGLTVSVRQIASYPAEPLAAPNDLVLVQSGGLGGPYASIPAATLVGTALSSGGAGVSSIGLGFVPPALSGSTMFATATCLPLGYSLLWNAYNSQAGVRTYWQNAIAGAIGFDGAGNFSIDLAPAGEAGALIGAEGAQQLAVLTAAGNLGLRGTLTVARDPASAMEVATMGWVGANTVASFNGRRGTVQLTANDVYNALCLDPCDPFITVSQTNAAICAAIQQLLASYPGVATWNGRLGNVWMNVCDLNIATFTAPPGMPAFQVPTPPPVTADPAPDPNTVVNIAWVENYLGSTAGFATEAWVTQQIATTAVTGFNGRQGAVTLTLADIQGAGGAPNASPSFSGVPTAPTATLGSSTSQIATTAFVMNAVSEATAGVASFNGRTGTVTLNATDLNNAGGALLNNPAFTGQPAAPTAAPGTSSAQLATTAFVANAIAGVSGVTSFNTRTGAITLGAGDINGAGGALLVSPAFSGTPTAPTAATGTDTTQLATTAFVVDAITSIGAGVTSFEGRTGAVTLQANDISAAGGLINPSVALTGVPTAPTATLGTVSTQIATTAFVAVAILAGTVASFNGRSGGVTLVAADLTAAGGALLASPTFTGTPSGPTAAPGTSTTQLATTGFVTAALTIQAANSVTAFNGRQGAVTLTAADITGAGGAPIASPNFTGTPTVPTATAGTATLQAASTAFVEAAIAASTAGVTSFNSRTGAVTLQTNDVSAVGGALLASPTFSGTPTAPTPAPGNNSTDIATTAFVQAALTGFSGVTSFNTRTGAVTLVAADINALSSLSLPAGSTANRNFNIQGVTDGSNAAAGMVGEYQTVGPTTSTAISSAVWTTNATLALSAGDWDVWGVAAFNPSAGMNIAGVGIGLTQNAGPVAVQTIAAALTAAMNMAAPTWRVSSAAAVSVYCNVYANYSAGSVGVSSAIYARRVR